MAKRKILITGGAGTLAVRLARLFSFCNENEVRAVARAELDITSRLNVEDVIDGFKPDVVINTAAMLVEASETTPEKAFHINAWGVRNLAITCERCGAALVQISTSGLFGDEIRPYHEYDRVVLKTTYAKSKYQGEVYARDLCKKHFVVRLGWLYGGGLEDRKDFVMARMMEAKGKKILQSAVDKYGSPTYADDAAHAIEALLESKEYGLYHVANDGGCKRSEYVRKIVESFGMDTVIEEADSTAFSRRADVPDCEILISYNLAYAGIQDLPPWQESLDRYISLLKKIL